MKVFYLGTSTHHMKLGSAAGKKCKVNEEQATARLCHMVLLLLILFKISVCGNTFCLVVFSTAILNLAGLNHHCF